MKRRSRFLNKYYVAIWGLLVVVAVFYGSNIFLACPELMEPYPGCAIEWGLVIAFAFLVSIVYNLIYLIIFSVWKRE